MLSATIIPVYIGPFEMFQFRNDVEHVHKCVVTTDRFPRMHLVEWVLWDDLSHVSDNVSDTEKWLCISANIKVITKIIQGYTMSCTLLHNRVKYATT